MGTDASTPFKTMNIHFNQPEFVEEVREGFFSLIIVFSLFVRVVVYLGFQISLLNAGHHGLVCNV